MKICLFIYLLSLGCLISCSSKSEKQVKEVPFNYPDFITFLRYQIDYYDIQTVILKKMGNSG